MVIRMSFSFLTVIFVRLYKANVYHCKEESTEVYWKFELLFISSCSVQFKLIFIGTRFLILIIELKLICLNLFSPKLQTVGLHTITFVILFLSLFFVSLLIWFQAPYLNHFWFQDSDSCWWIFGAVQTRIICGIRAQFNREPKCSCRVVVDLGLRVFLVY